MATTTYVSRHRRIYLVPILPMERHRRAERLPASVERPHDVAVIAVGIAEARHLLEGVPADATGLILLLDDHIEYVGVRGIESLRSDNRYR